MVWPQLLVGSSAGDESPIAAMRPVPSVEVANVAWVLVSAVPVVIQMWPLAFAFDPGDSVMEVEPNSPRPLPAVVVP